MQPGEYLEFLLNRQGDAIEKAWQSRAPGSVGWGLGHAVVGRNRRTAYADGHAEMYGKTWIDRQQILEGYNPNFFGFIQIRGGRLVATVPHLVRDPGRYVACVLTSDDDGKTWTKPVVLARQKNGQLSYPLCLERRPGELWVIAGFAFQKGWQGPVPLRLKINEDAFLSEAKKGS